MDVNFVTSSKRSLKARHLSAVATLAIVIGGWEKEKLLGDSLVLVRLMGAFYCDNK